MAKTKVKVIVALFAVIALSLLAVCFGRLFSPAEAKAADGTYDDTAAFALMTALATNDEVTLTQDVVFDLTVPSRITGSGTMKENGHMDIVGNKTIDLAGFTLTIITGSENCCVEVTPNASLTIKDSSAAGTGKVVGQSAGDFAWGQTGTSISLTNVDVEFTSTETGAAGDEGTTPGGSSEDHVILSNGSVELSGVTFDTNVSDPVAVFTKDAQTGEFVGSDVTYGTLQDAINAGETSITLDRDYTESITVSKGQNVTLDLSGHKITSSEAKTVYNNGGTLTINGNGGTVENTNEKTGASSAVAVFNSGSTASLTINGGTYKANTTAIYGGVTLSIDNATISGGRNGIYASFSSSNAARAISISNSTFTGGSSYGIRTVGALSLTIKNTNITSTGVAINVSKEKLESTEFTFNGGNVTGKVNLYAGVNASIESGDFTKATINYKNAEFSISGGTFAEMPSPTYLASSEYAIYRNGEAGSYTYEIAAISSKPDVDPYRTLNDKVTVGNHGFDSVAAAVEAINDGTATGTITLIASVEENISVTSGNVAIALNGNTVTGDVSVSNGATLSITGVGKVTGMVSSEGKLTISGGTFGQLLPKEWLATGTALSVNDDLAFTVVESETIATMTKADDSSYIFDSLQSATYAAPIGEKVTITLEKDITADSQLISARDNRIINYDLNGKTITFTEAADDQTVITLNSGTYTFTNGTITRVRPDGWSEGKVNAIFEIFVGTSTSPRANVTFGEDFTAEATNGASVAYIHNYADLTVDGATLKSDTDWTIHGFGGEQIGEQQTTINIKNGTVESTGAAAIYQPQVGGTINVSGGTVNGVTGIEIRNGALNVTGGKIIATGAFSASGTPSGGGSTVSGAAVAVTKYDNNEMLTVNISGGELIAEDDNGHAVYEGYPDSEDGKYPEGNELSLTVSSGEFTGAVDSKNETGFISGGEFDGMPESDYIAAGADLYMNADKSGFAVATESAPEGYKKVVATIVDTAYTSLAEAVEEAEANATIVLYADVTESVTVAADDVITLDLNGKTLTSDTDNVATILNNGTLSIVDTSDEKGTITRGATTYYVIRNEGVMTISDVNVENLTSDPSSLVANNTDCKSDGAAQLTIKSGSFTSAASNAVKNDEYGILTIDGGVFETKINTHAAVQTWATATINGGTFTATAQAISIEVYNGQTNTTTINNGTFNAPTAVYMSDGYDVGATYPGGDMNIEIKGGTFNGAIAESATCPIDDEDGGVAISGGTFTEVFDAEYLAEDADMYVAGDKYTAATEDNKPDGAELVVAVIGTKGYTSLNAAIADVKVGAASQFSEETTVITLMTDTKDSSDIGTSNGQAPKNVTIDLNGHTLTLGPGVGSAGTETAGLRVLAYSTLTVKNGTLKCSDDTADHILVGIANYGKTTLENVTLDAAEVTQYPVNNRGELTLKGDTTVENGGVYDIAITNDPYNYYYKDVDASLNIADPEVTVGTVRLELYGNATNNGVPVLNVSAGTLQTIITDGNNAIGFESNVSGATFEELPDAGLIGDSDMYQTADGKFKASDSTVEGATKVIAMVSDKAYDKLADAVAAATDGGTVTLYVDVKENITVASGTVTIDLAGNTLNGFIKSTGATVNVKNGTVSGSWIDGAVMANGEGASVTLTDTVIGNPISISNDGAVTLVRSTTRGRITVGSGSAPENYTAGTLTITDSIIEKEISVEMLGKVVISDTVEYKTSFASGVKVTAKDPAALEAFKGYGVTTVVHVANEEQLLKALELGVSEIEVQSTELSAPVEITKDVKIYGGNKGDHEIVGSFIVKGEIEVTIEDVSFAGDGTGAALTVTDGAKLTYSDNLSNVTVAVSGFEAGISVDGNSSATVNNITFENISAAAEVKDGKSDAVTFNGCTIPEDTAQYVAVVTDATNLASAIADSKFAKVTLGADVELTSALVIERSVTLDLNGYDITGNINVTAADVTITAPETSDSAINGIVTVTSAKNFTLSNLAVNYTANGEIAVDSDILGVIAFSDSEATINNVAVNVTAKDCYGDTIRVIANVLADNGSAVTINDSTIDLDLTFTEPDTAVVQGQVVRAKSSDLTIKDSEITTTDYGVIFYGDMTADDAQNDNISNFDKLVIENSEVTVVETDGIVGERFAISGNGSNRNGTIIEITGSTITSDTGTAIYHPQYGNMTITDSVITGASGIEMRSGNLTVTSGTITATGAFEVEPNGNGNTASGVAVAVSQHTTEMKINVQLNGGTFNATGENGKAFYETDTVTGADPSADVTADLNGGTYEAAVEAKNIKNFINDGLYKEEPKEDAFAEGYEGVLYNGYYQVVEATTDDPAALLTAKTEAQADVRSYLLNACGMTIADVKALAADETLGAAAQAVIDAYAAMDGATSESKLAIARLSVMDAIDALDKALDTALADYKAAAIEAINSYGAEKDVAVPTATIMAINSAKTEAEVDMYKEYAIGEIDDIVAYREAISNIEIPDYSDTLDALSDKLDTLTGNLASVSNDLGAKIDAVKTDIATVTADIDKLETALAGLADSDDVNGIAEDISDIIEQLAAIKSTVDGISVAVDEATAVEEVKTEAAAEIDAWLEDYIDSIVESSATSVRDILTAKAAMADDLRSKLVDAFGEDNAALIEKYYDDAMSAIENATSASEATNAVSTFKAQVASVEAAAGNTTSLAGVYVLLAIILVVAIVAVVLAVVLKRKGGEPAPATAQPAPEAAPAPAPAAETAPAPAATEEAPAAQPEDESAATATDEDTERVVITASTRTFEEAYEALDPELRDLFDKVKAYALSKNGTTEVKLSNCICIKYGSKKVVRLTVRRSYPLAMFVIENEMVKDFRRNATGALKLKVPATELVIRDEEDLKAAYSMVDLAVDQILKDIEAAKERRRAARRARRAQREAEAGEAGETPEAPEAPDDGGKK